MEYLEFENDFTEKYSKEEFAKVDSIIEQLFDNGFDETKLHSNEWEVNVSVEKINQLQENVFITFTRNDDEFYLEYENGINNGTQLNDFSFENNLEPTSKTAEIVDDVVIDKEKIQQWNNERQGKEVVINWNRIEMLFEKFKPKILKNIKEQNYDNYVTGGGTIKTDSHYKQKENDLESKGVFWIVKYKEIEVDVIWKR